MGANLQEFKLPDEQGEQQVEDEKLEIVIDDDTPPEDRNRQPLPKEIVKELEDDDLSSYSEKVSQRLAQMKKVWHDERREKESAQRQADEAARFAAAQLEENKQLKKQLGVGEKMFVQEVNKAAQNELTVAREKLKAAFETNDPDEISKAQEALMDAKLKVREFSQLRPSLQEDEEGVQRTTQAAPSPAKIVPDEKASAWRQKNTWFGSDPEMTALALGLHDRLVRSGTDPTSDEYYSEINKTMRKRFPEKFSDEEARDSALRDEARPTPPARKQATTVAPATRSTAPRQVRLTPSQVAIAKRLGLSNEAYAKELIKLEKANG